MKRKRLRVRVRRFLEAYYDTLHRLIQTYSSIASDFPYYLKGPKQAIATFGKDGIVIIQSAAEKQSVQFQDSEMTMAALHAEHTLGIVQLQAPPYRSGRAVSGKSHRRTKISGIQFERDGKRTTWEEMEIATFSELLEPKWTEEGARLEATESVMFQVSAHLMRADTTKPGMVLDKLDAIISEFKTLLESNPTEELVQQYLAKNPVVLDPGAARIWPKAKLGNEHITDFIIERASQEYVMVEIEAPGHPLFNQSGDPSKWLTHAERQVTDWRQWVHDNIAYARSRFPGINDPACLVIIGRRTNMTEANQRSLARMNAERHHINILTYDDLINIGKRHLKNMRRLVGD